MEKFNMSEIIFYTNPMSRGRVVRWMLEEICQPYKTELLGFDGGMNAQAFRAINPMGKVPALVHNGTVITETAAIIAYLAETFPEYHLCPTTLERGAYYRWMFFAAGPLEQALFVNNLGISIPEEKRIAAGFGDYQRTLDTLEVAIQSAPYLAGDRFTAADLYVASHISAGIFMNTIEKRPTFIDYAKRMTTRPAYIRASDIDNALIAR
jgi:glutathione S-transferase